MFHKTPKPTNPQRGRPLREQYDRLVDEDIYDATPAGRDIGGAEFGGKFAQYGSWALWDAFDTAPQAAARSAALIQEWEQVDGLLHNNVVLVALNLGRPDTAGLGAGDNRTRHEGAWENFHSGGRDFVLARAIEQSPFRGAYITDFYKGLPTRTGREREIYLAERDPAASTLINTVMRSILDREIEILGARCSSGVLRRRRLHRRIASVRR